MGTVETNNNTINFTANDDVVYNKYDVDNNYCKAWNDNVNVMVSPITPSQQ